MKHAFSAVIVALVLAAFACNAQAATYYVSNSGLDSNPGTQTQPWATLQKAVDTIAAGDTILVMPGTYVGCRIRYAGVVGAPKTLRSQTVLAAAVASPGPLNRKSCNIELDADNYTDPISYWVVDGFELKNAPVAGAKALLTPYLQFTNNWCHNNGTGGNGHDGFYGIAPNGLFANNVFSNNAEHGLYVGQGVMDYAVIRDNVAGDNQNMGFHNNGDKGAPFDTDGMLDYFLIERNKAYNCFSSHGMDGDGMRFSTLRNNLIYAVENCGIMLTGVSGAEVSHHNRVLNNTILTVHNFAVHIYRRGGDNNKLFNNILYWGGTGNDYGGSIALSTTLAQVGFESNYNAVVNKFSLANKAKTLSQWRTYGYDLNSFLSTPAALFVDPANSNYHLKVGSPAANAGTTLSDVTDDIDGEARPQGTAYDVGCYEDF